MKYNKLIDLFKKLYDRILFILPKVKNLVDTKSIQNSKKEMSKKNFTIILSFVVLIVFFLTFFGYYIGKSNSSLDNTLNAFRDSLNSDNESKLRKIILDDDKKINRDYIKPLTDYYDKSSIKIESTIDQLKNSGESDDFTLVKKNYILFTKYYLKIKKYSITVNSNYENGKFKIETKDGDSKNYTYKTANSGETIRDVYPGVYRVKGILKSDYGDIEADKDVLIMSDKLENIDFNAVDITVNSDFNDADIFINDTDTGLKVSDNKKIGPLNADGSLKVHIEQDSPFGILKSEDKEITNVPTINLNVKIEGEQLENDIKTLVSNFYKSVYKALNEEDKDSINNCTNDVKDKIFNILSQKYFILKNKYDITDMSIDKDKSELKYDGENYKGIIVVTIDYNVSKKLFGLDKQENHKNFFTRIIYKNDTWIIEDIDNFEL